MLRIFYKNNGEIDDDSYWYGADEYDNPINDTYFSYLKDLYSRAWRDRYGVLYCFDNGKKVCLPNLKEGKVLGEWHKDYEYFDTLNGIECYENLPDVYEIEADTVEIIDGTFRGQRNTKFIIPSSVEFIGAAFRDCRNIEIEFYGYECEVDPSVFDGTDEIDTIGSFFTNRDGSICVDLDKVIHINHSVIENIEPGNSSYAKDDFISIYKVPQGVRAIDYHAFWDNIFNVIDFSLCRHEDIVPVINSISDFPERFRFPSDFYVIVDGQQYSALDAASCNCVNILNLDRESTDVDGIFDYKNAIPAKDGYYYSPSGTRLICFTSEHYSEFDFIRNRALFEEQDEIPPYNKSLVDKEPLDMVLKRGVSSWTTSICDYAFSYSNINCISLPTSLKHIGVASFYACSWLTQVRLPDDLVEIPDFAFCHCTRLKKVVFPKSLKKIGNFAFYGCTSLEEVSIPLSTRYIGDKAFYHCNSLQKVEVATAFYSAFDNPNQIRKGVVAPSLVDNISYGTDIFTYRTISEWDEYKALIREQAYYLFFDTETSGLPIDERKSPSDTDNWPRLVQLSWLVTDNKGRSIKNSNHLIKPDGFVIEQSAQKVHGISSQYAYNYGENIIDVLDEFLHDVKCVTCIVGHNIKFDINVVASELYRYGYSDILSNALYQDTMIMSRKLRFLKDKSGRLKDFKLQELHRFLFGKEFDNAHDAFFDVTATKDCFFRLRKGLHHQLEGNLVPTGEPQTLTEQELAQISQIMICDNPKLGIKQMKFFMKNGKVRSLTLSPYCEQFTAGTKIRPSSVTITELTDGFFDGATGEQVFIYHAQGEIL